MRTAALGASNPKSARRGIPPRVGINADWYDFVAQLFDPRTVIGLFLYGGAALLYIIALRRIPMSVALPCTASSYIAAALIGHYEFAEPLTAMHLAALALICAGVVILALA